MASPSRVLLVPSAYLPNVGGLEEATRRLAAGLRARGVEVAIVTNRWPSTTEADETIEGVDVHRLAFELPGASLTALRRFAGRGPRTARAFLSLSRMFLPQVLHVIGAGPNAAYAVALRRLLGVPTVLSVHGELSGDARGIFLRSATLRLSLRRLCSTADAVTAPSAYTLDELRAHYHVRGITAVIPNGVDVADFAEAPPRSDLGRYVLAVGRLVPQKGLDTLVDAFAAVHPDLEGRRLVIAGDGPERPQLERHIASAGLEHVVLLLGSVERAALPSLFAGADAVVVASRRESFPLVALEAMAARRPLVATDVGGLPEVVRDGENALVVSPDDADALASALRRLFTEGGLRERLSASAHEDAGRRSWDTVVSSYLHLYERVLR